MTEEAPEGFEARSYEQDSAQDSSVSSADPTRTGVASVDAVLDELAGIDALPLEEHVDAFERAHESLRSALDAPPGATPDAVADASPGDLA